MSGHEGITRLPERIASKIAVDEETGCWLWTACLDRHGYARLQVGKRKTVGAHRAVWEILVGKIPPGKVIDHVRKRGCVNRHCVNPAHMEPVTGKTNTLRGNNPAAINARKTHCKHGHEFSPENTAILGDGSRQCRICRAALQHRRWVNREVANV